MSCDRERALAALRVAALASIVAVILALGVTATYWFATPVVYLLALLMRLESLEAMNVLVWSLFGVAELSVVAVILLIGRALRARGRGMCVVCWGTAIYCGVSVIGMSVPERVSASIAPFAMIHAPAAAFMMVAALTVHALLSRSSSEVRGFTVPLTIDGATSRWRS